MDRTATFDGLGVSISDWSNLKLRLTMIAGDGAGMGASDEMEVTTAYLETQDAPSGGSDPRKQNFAMTDPSMGVQGLENNFTLE